MRRSIFSIFVHTRFNVDEPFYSRLTFVYLFFFCTVVVACNSHWYVNDKKIGFRWWYLTAQSKIVLDSKCVCCSEIFVKRDQLRQKKGRGKRRESKRMAKKQHQNFLHKPEICLNFFLSMFLFVCMLFIASPPIIWVGPNVLSPVLTVFVSMHDRFCMCVNAKPLLLLFLLSFFILLDICISNKFACKNQHLQWYLDLWLNCCTVCWFVCSLFSFLSLGGGNF